MVVGNPRQVRDFAKATGNGAKTDRLDAQSLAHFAQAIRPEPRPLADEATQRMAALLSERLCRRAFSRRGLRCQLPDSDDASPWTDLSRSLAISCDLEAYARTLGHTRAISCSSGQ